MLKKLTKKRANNRKALDGYRYHFDMVSPDLIAGWAFKEGYESHTPVIEVRSGKAVLWTAEANTFREDLLQAGFGSGQYGFSIEPSSLPVSSSVTSVDLFIDGHRVQKGVPFEIAPRDVARYRVSLDDASSDEIRGWVFKDDEPNYRAKVEARCGDAVIASGLAGDFRQDLLDADIGDGHYAFSLSPRLDQFPSAECECRLFIDGEQANVEPFILLADADVIADELYKAQFAAEIEDFNNNVETTLARLKHDIVSLNRTAAQDDLAVSGQLQVAMQSIAELSVRVKTIEQVLIKHFPAK